MPRALRVYGVEGRHGRIRMLRRQSASSIVSGKGVPQYGLDHGDRLRHDGGARLSVMRVLYGVRGAVFLQDKWCRWGLGEHYS